MAEVESNIIKTSKRKTRADSDTEGSDDDEIFCNDNKFICLSPSLSVCSNDGIINNESFYQCFGNRYNACPAFFIGSLFDACQEAFSSNVIKERCPILVYLHNDKSMFDNIFCRSIFCSTIIIDYLLENYIVWPWDITYESNRNILENLWNEMFSTEIFDDCSVEQCPMLIGIMRLFVEEKDDLLKSEYQFKILLKGDTLIRTAEKSSRETVLKELVNFKEECDDNEQILLCDFISKTGFCWEIILEITKYLSLNDAITAFSNNILPILHKYKAKVQITYPSDSFTKLILRKINIEQITSLQIDTVQISSTIQFDSLIIFNKVITLILFNLQDIKQINEYEKYFPQLNCLCLWYDNEVDLSSLSSIFQYSKNPIKRFEIHYASSDCTHHFNMKFAQNTTIEYFLLDIAQHPLLTIEEYFQHHDKCFLMTIIDFIKIMHNIRYVYIITNKYNIKNLLDVNEWKNLTHTCYRLKKITLKVLGSIFEDEQLSKKVVEIQNELCKEQKTIKFQVVFM